MFLPLTDSDLVTWLNNFAKVFARHAPRLGFSSAEVASVANDAAMLEYLVRDELPAYEKALSVRINYKNRIKDGATGNGSDALISPLPITTPPAGVKPGIVPRLIQLKQRIRSSPGFTNNLAAEFGFQSDESTPDFESIIVKPTGRAFGQFESEVRVEFIKSYFDGVLIESRRTGQDEWKRLAINNFSPYVDSRPLARSGRPEVREYRLRFLMQDELVGEWSDILVATASV